MPGAGGEVEALQPAEHGPGQPGLTGSHGGAEPRSSSHGNGPNGRNGQGRAAGGAMALAAPRNGTGLVAPPFPMWPHYAFVLFIQRYGSWRGRILVRLAVL